MHTLNSTAYRALAIELDRLNLAVAAFVVHHRIDTPDLDARVTVLACDPDNASRECVIHAYLHSRLDREPYHTDDASDAYDCAILDADDMNDLDANGHARLRLLSRHV